jgi:hypothetical protein
MEELQWEEGRNKLWKELGSLEPQQIESRIGLSCRDGRYVVPFLGRDCSVDIPAGHIQVSVSDPLAGDPDFELLLLTYLLRSMHIDPSGKWVSEKELPGGSNFFSGQHRLPFEALEKRFGEDVAGFRRRCQALQGRELEFGDASFAFEPLACIPLACVLYGQDEEFPPRITLLFDSTISYQLPLDMVLALVHSFAVVLQSPLPGDTRCPDS